MDRDGNLATIRATPHGRGRSYTAMNETRRWLHMSVVIAATAFGACADDGYGTVAESEASATIADALCGMAQDCRCFTDNRGSAEECRAEFREEWQSIFDAGKAAGLTYDGACVGRILDAYTASGCEVEVAEEDLFTDCAPCKFFHGTKIEGEPCEQGDGLAGDDECAQGLGCNGAVCVDPCKTAGEGEPCVGRHCDEGLVCLLATDAENGANASTCHRTAGVGEDCSASFCADGLSCDPTTVTCQDPPRAAEGEPCAMSECDADLYCDRGDGMLEPTGWVCAPLQGPNDPCTDDEACRSGTCRDGTCLEEQAFACQLI